MKTNLTPPSARLVPILSALCCIIIIIIVSCSKSEKSNAPQTASSVDMISTTSSGTAFFNMDIDDDDIDAIEDDSSSCATITYDGSPDVYPNTKTITYDHCQTCKGVTVNGTRTIVRYMDKDSAKPGDLIREATYDNITYNSVKVSGTVKNYKVSDDPLTVRVVISRTYTAPANNGVGGTFGAEYVRIQTGGNGTKDKSDDVYANTGNAHGTVSLYNGKVADFTISIDKDNPIVKQRDCCWRSSGKETLKVHVTTNENESSFTDDVDYGNGDCNDWVDVSRNGGTPKHMSLPQLTLF